MAGLNHLLTGDFHFPEIKPKIWEARSHLKDIGMELGVNSGDLAVISLMNRGDPSSCFKEMLVVWLRYTYTCRCRTMAYTYMCRCINATCSLAEQIEKK